MLNILLIATLPGRVGVFATADPKGLAAEIGLAAEVDRHYTIPCDKAHDVERAFRQSLSHRALGAEGTWFGLDFDSALLAVATTLESLGLDNPVVRGVIRPRKPCKGVARHLCGRVAA